MEAQERIYLDHAATTPLDEEVLQKMLPYFTQTYGNANSQHYFGRKAMGALDEARGVIARLIGANDNEVYFTSGGTEADNLAVFGAAPPPQKRGKNARGRQKKQIKRKKRAKKLVFFVLCGKTAIKSGFLRRLHTALLDLSAPFCYNICERKKEYGA